MIQIFKHRCNLLNDLNEHKSHWGAEIDLRSHGDHPQDLILSHDPWKIGDSFRAWLKIWKSKNINAPLILNTKEDGLEGLAISLLQEFEISNYLFLDTTIPTLKNWTRDQHLSHFFIRWSSLEPLEFTLLHKNYCSWVWIDCFDRIPPQPQIIETLSLHFKTCLVSPELQGGNKDDIIHFRNLFHNNLHGVCTKYPELWEGKL